MYNISTYIHIIHFIIFLMKMFQKYSYIYIYIF